MVALAEEAMAMIHMAVLPTALALVEYPLVVATVVLAAVTAPAVAMAVPMNSPFVVTNIPSHPHQTTIANSTNSLEMAATIRRRRERHTVVVPNISVQRHVTTTPLPNQPTRLYSRLPTAAVDTDSKCQT